MSEPEIKPLRNEGEPPMCSAECPQYCQGAMCETDCGLYQARDVGEVCVPAVLHMAAKRHRVCECGCLVIGPKDSPCAKCGSLAGESLAVGFAKMRTELERAAAAIQYTLDLPWIDTETAEAVVALADGKKVRCGHCGGLCEELVTCCDFHGGVCESCADGCEMEDDEAKEKSDEH